MSKARLIITAVVLERRCQADVARDYDVSKGWVSKLVARYRAEGETAFEPRSRRPHSHPNATPPETVELIVSLRRDLAGKGLDHGPDTIVWHLAQHHGVTISAATVSRLLTKAGLVEPAPKKRPKTSLRRFEAAMPNECWQADFTHWPLADGTDVEILCWLDDCTRYAIRVTAHAAVTGAIVLAEFRQAMKTAGIPASTLTDNGMVFTTRFAGGRGGRNGFEAELRRLHIVQKNSRPSHPMTCGKVERFHQTLKDQLRALPAPATIAELQAQIDDIVDEYNHRRPHSSLPHSCTPATRWNALPKAVPGNSRDADTHARVRHDIIDQTGVVTLRVNGRLHHIGIGRTHARTHVIMLVADLNVRVVNAITGELLRELTIDTSRDYQPQKKQETPEP